MNTLLRFVRAVRSIAEQAEDLLTEGPVALDALEERPFTILPPEQIKSIRDRFRAAPKKRARFIMAEGQGAPEMVAFLQEARSDVGTLLYVVDRHQDKARAVYEVLQKTRREAMGKSMTASMVDVWSAVERVIGILDPMADASPPAYGTPRKVVWPS